MYMYMVYITFSIQIKVWVLSLLVTVVSISGECW